MKGSRSDLIKLSNIDPANPHYDSQLGRLFNVLHYRMNLPASLTASPGNLNSTTAFRVCLSNLHKQNEGSARLSEGFTRLWPAIWKVIGSVLFPCLIQDNFTTETRQFARREVVGMCSVLGRDDPILLEMISTPGFSSLALEIWAMEVERPEYQSRDDGYCTSMAAFLDRVFILASQEKHELEVFLEPMNGDMKYLASTALKHLQHAYFRKRPNMHCVIWSVHIITVLSGIRDPIRNAFLTQNCVPAVTKFLVTITAEVLSPATASLKGEAIAFGFWNLLLMMQATDGATWVIQALEAKLMFALVRCEPWLSYMDDDPVKYLYPFLNQILPNYSAYRSVLCVIEKSLTKIQQSGLDAGKSQDTPLWNAWNSFVKVAEYRLEILASAPGGLLRTQERCHSATVSPDILLSTSSF
jgi:hypothetical protein